MAASPAPRDGETTVPAAAALVVLASGFGALCLFWTLGPRPAGLPGLFAFASATWGDSLALPAMTAFLLYAVRSLPPARADRAFATTAGVLGGAAGAATQAWWLAADHPRPNWTLPRPHHFTTAGWYHAAFLVVLCAALAALLALALNRATLAPVVPRRVVVALVAALACGLAFTALLVADAGASPGAAGPAAVLAGVVATLLASAVVVFLRR